MNILLRLLGDRLLHKTIASHTQRNPLDVKFGIALLRDGRIRFRTKLLAFGLGVGLLALLLAFEVPLEAVVTFLMPFLLPVPFVVDGIETVALPILFMALLIQYMAPRPIVDSIRAERFAQEHGPIVDVESYDPRTANTMQSLPLSEPNRPWQTNGPTLSTSQMDMTQPPIFAGSRRA